MVCVCVCVCDSTPTCPAVFSFESWNSSKVRAEIITLEAFIFFSEKIFSQLKLGMMSSDSKYNTSHLSNQNSHLFLIYERRKEMFYLTMKHQTHFIYGYMASNLLYGASQ